MAAKLVEMWKRALKRPFCSYAIRRCPFLHHAPTRSISFALTLPLHSDRSTRHEKHSWRRILRNGHGLLCHRPGRSPLSVSSALRHRKRPGRGSNGQSSSPKTCVQSSLCCLFEGYIAQRHIESNRICKFELSYEHI